MKNIINPTLIKISNYYSTDEETRKNDKKIKQAKTDIIEYIKNNEAEAKETFDILSDYNYTNYTNIPSNINLEKLQSKMKSFITKMSNNKPAYIIDIETLGNPNKIDNSFSITEIALSKMEKGKITDVNTLVFGISHEQWQANRRLIHKLNTQSLSDFTPEEISTLERLSRYSGTFKKERDMIDPDDYRFEKDASGFYKIHKLAPSDRFNIDKLYSGNTNLYRLGDINKQIRQLYGSKTPTMQAKVEELYKNILKAYDSTLLTFYGSNFDMPLIKKMFKEYGFDTNVFNEDNHIDVFEAMKAAYFGEEEQLYKDFGTDMPQNEIGRLQTMVKQLGIKSDNHLASDDAHATGKVFFAKGLYHKINKRINDKISNNKSNKLNEITKNSTVLFANKSIRTEKYDIITDSNGKIKPYTYAINKNNTYAVDNFYFLGKEEIEKANTKLTSYIKKAGIVFDDEQKGLYIMKLNDASKKIKDTNTVYLVRKSKDDFIDIFNSNMKILEFVKQDSKERKSLTSKQIDQDLIDSSKEMWLNDKSRRLYRKMLSEDFDTAKKFYSTFNNIKNFFMPLYEDDKNKETIFNYEKKAIKSLIEGNEIKINDKVIEPDIFNGFKSTEEKYNFLYMYDYLNNNYVTANKVISYIDNNFDKQYFTSNIERLNNDKMLNIEKANLLGNTIKSIEQDTKNNIVSIVSEDMGLNLGNEKLPNNFSKNKINEIKTEVVNNYIKDTSKKPRTYNDINLFTIPDMDVSVNVSSKQSAYSSILSSIKNIGIDKKNNALVMQAKNQYLKEIAEKLHTNNLMGYEVYKNISNSKDLYYMAKSIANSLYNVSEDAKKNYTIDELSSSSEILEKDMADIEERSMNEVIETNRLINDKNKISYSSILRRNINNFYSKNPNKKILRDFNMLHTNSDVENLNPHTVVPYYNNENNSLEKSYVTFDNIVDEMMENNNDYEYIEKKAQNAIDNKINIIDVGNTKNKDIKALFNLHGYTDEETQDFLETLNNKKYGLTTKNNISIALYEDKDNNLKMAITKKEKSNILYKKLSAGEDISDDIATVVSFKDVQKNIGTRYFKYGASNKAIYKKLNIYSMPSMEGSYNELGDLMRGKVVTTSGESLTAIRLVANKIVPMIQEGKNGMAREILQRAIDRPINSSKGLIGNEVVKIGNAKVYKFLPTMSDFNSNSLIDITALPKAIPLLWYTENENDNMRKEIEKVFTSDDVSADKAIKRIRENINNITFNDLNNDQRQFILKNSNEIIEKFYSYTHDYKGKEESGIKDIIGKINYMGADHDIIKGILSTKDARNIVPNSFMAPFTRPLYTQWQSGKALVLNASNKPIFDNKKYQITFGSEVGTRDYLEYKNFAQENKIPGAIEGIDVGFTGNMKMMSTGEVLSNIKRFENKYNTDTKKLKFLKKINNKFDANFSIEQFDDLINKFKFSSTTFEQGGMFAPYVTNDIFNTHELTSMKIDKDKNFKLSEGIEQNTVIHNGDVIGNIVDNDNNVIEKIKYNKEDAYFQGYKNDHLYFEPVENRINEIKGSFGAAEKFVASRIDDGKNTKLAQEMWNSIIGENIAGVANFEITKHENGPLVWGSELNKMYYTAMQNNETDFFLKILNGSPSAIKKLKMESGLKRFGRGELKSIKELKKLNYTIQNGVLLPGNIQDKEIDFASGVENLSKLFRTRADNLNLPGYDLLKDESIKRGIISRQRMNESYPSKGELSVIDEGVKVNPRLTQTAMSRIGKNIDDFYVKTDSGYKKKIDIFFKDLKEDMYMDKNNSYAKPFINATKDLSNMLTATRIVSGTDKEYKSFDVNFSDLNMGENGVDAKSLFDTVFDIKDKNGKIPDVLKINFDNGFKIKNPYTEKMEDFILIPTLHTNTYDGIEFLSESQKNINDLMTNISGLFYGDNRKYKENEFDTRLSKINNSYKNVYTGFFDEFKSKKGLFQKFVNSGRIKNSGISLNVGVFPIISTDKYSKSILKQISNIDEKEFIKNGFTNYIDKFKKIKLLDKDLIKVEGDNVKFYDIAYTSEKQLKDMGIDFEKLGKQQVQIAFSTPNSKVYRNKDFLKYVNNLDIESLIKDANEKYGDKLGAKNVYERIGKRYAEIAGINGLLTRYPTFLSTSSNIVRFKLNKNMTGNTVATFSHTAKKLNLDTDADFTADILNIKDGAIDLSKDYEIEMQRQNEALNNDMYVYDSIVSSRNAEMHTGKYTYTMKDFMKAMLEDRPDYKNNQNFYAIEGAEEDALIAKQYKNEIGLISNPNFSIRNMAATKYRNNESAMRNIDKVLDFTDTTEQKLLDKKHGVRLSTETAGLLYSNGINQMAKGDIIETSKGIIKKNNIEEGFNKVLKAVYNAGITDNLLTYKDVISGNIKKDDVFESSLPVILDLFTDKKAIETFNNPFTGGRVPNKKDKLEAIKNLAQNPDYYAKDFVGEEMAENVKKIKAINENIVIGKAKINIGDIFINGKNAYSYNGIKSNGYLFYADLTNKNGNNLHIYGTDINKIKNNLERKTIYVGKNSNSNFHKANQIITDNLIGTADYLKEVYNDAALMRIRKNKGDFHKQVFNLFKNSTLSIDDQGTIANNIIETLEKNHTNGIRNTVKYIPYIQIPIGLHKKDIKVIQSKNNEISEIYLKTMNRIYKLKQGGIINQNQSAKIIKQINNEIKRKGKNAKKISPLMDNLNGIIDNVLKKETKVIYNSIGSYLNHYDKKDISIFPKNEALYNELSNIKTLNVEDFKNKLDEAYKEKFKSNISNETYSKYVLDPVNELNATNKENINRMETIYNNLLETNDSNINKILNWTNDFKGKDIDILGTQKIAFSKYTGMEMKDLSISQLVHLYSADVDTTAGIKTQARIGNYLDALFNNKNNDFMLNAYRATKEYSGNTKIDESIIKQSIDAMNNDIKKLGKEKAKDIKIEKEFDKKALMDNAKHILTNRKVLIGFACVSAAALLYNHFSNNNLNANSKPNGKGSPNVDGTYAEEIPIKAPSSKKAYMSKNNSGTNYRIKADSNNDSDENNTAQAIKNAVGANTNVTINVNRKQTDQNWLKRQFNNLLGRQ